MKAKTPKAPVIDIEIMRGPILTVWNSIGGDYSDLGRVTNLSAIEASIDADRLTTFRGYGDKGKAASVAAEAELQRAIDAHGYDKVLRALGRAIRLV
jgi:hypothetical protein